MKLLPYPSVALTSHWDSSACMRSVSFVRIVSCIPEMDVHIKDVFIVGDLPKNSYTLSDTLVASLRDSGQLRELPGQPSVHVQSLYVIGDSLLKDIHAKSMEVQSISSNFEILDVISGHCEIDEGHDSVIFK